MRDQLREDLIRDEGVKEGCYLCTAGKHTVGVGRNLDDVGLRPDEQKALGCTAQDIISGKVKLTGAQIDLLLDNDITRVFNDLDRELPWWRGRPDDVQRGLANMCFQLGIGGLLKFKNMLSCLHAGDYEGARKNALDSKWAKSDSPKRAERVTALFTAGHPFN